MLWGVCSVLLRATGIYPGTAKQSLSFNPSFALRFRASYDLVFTLEVLLTFTVFLLNSFSGMNEPAPGTQAHFTRPPPPSAPHTQVIRETPGTRYWRSWSSVGIVFGWPMGTTRRDGASFHHVVHARLSRISWIDDWRFRIEC